MQTFLPYRNFTVSVLCLDYRRLGKQRVEARQILTSLEKKSGWINHPATKMWDGFEDALTLYSNECIKEWGSRGYKNTMPILPTSKYPKMPDWIGGKIHETHRAALKFKDPEYYEQYDWDEPAVLDYYWPTKDL